MQSPPFENWAIQHERPLNSRSLLSKQSTSKLSEFQLRCTHANVMQAVSHSFKKPVSPFPRRLNLLPSFLFTCSQIWSISLSQNFVRNCESFKKKKTVTPKCCQNYEIWGCESFFQIVVLLIHLLVQVDVLLLVISDLLQNLLQQLLWPSHPLFPKVCFKSLDLFGVDQGALEEREDKYSIHHKTKIQNWYWKF